MLGGRRCLRGLGEFYKLPTRSEYLGYEYLLLVTGRAAEHLLAKTFISRTFIPMNYHFTTTKAHFNLMGATVLELFGPRL